MKALQLGKVVTKGIFWKGHHVEAETKLKALMRGKNLSFREEIFFKMEKCAVKSYSKKKGNRIKVEGKCWAGDQRGGDPPKNNRVITFSSI